MTTTTITTTHPKGLLHSNEGKVIKT